MKISTILNLETIIHKWLVYNGCTVLIIVTIYLLQLLAGSFIRWEVGDVVRPLDKTPYVSLAKGWDIQQCIVQYGTDTTACIFVPHKY